MSKLSIISVFGLLLSAILFVTGCEVDSATETIIINPSTVTVREGQSVAFTAEGGYEYTWSLSSSGSASTVMGTLSSTRGASITYTSLYNPTTSNAVTEILSVSSTIPGDATSTNSSSALQGSASAIITHLGLSE
jgi:hypothetical protein